MQNQNVERKTIDGLYVAKCFKHFTLTKNKYMNFVLPIERIAALSEYKKHSKTYNDLAFIFNKYGLDVVKYIDYYVNNLKNSYNDIDSSLVNISTINSYLTYLKSIDERNIIFNAFNKSVLTIAKECVDLGIYSVKDYIRKIIKKRLIAQYYLTGKISSYYLASIPSFKKIITKLDALSLDEFHTLYDNFEIINAKVTDAFLHLKNMKVNPIRMTDDKIFELRNKT